MCKFKELQISLAEHAVGREGEETTVAFHRLTGADAGTNRSTQHAAGSRSFSPLFVGREGQQQQQSGQQQQQQTAIL
jgi:hypothetical protein